MLTDMSLPWGAWAAMGAGLVAFVVMIAITIKRHRGMHRSLFASPYTLWMIIFTVVPVVLISYYSFTDANGKFTLDNFKNFWDSHYEANKVIKEEAARLGVDYSQYITRGTVNVDTLVYSLWMWSSVPRTSCWWAKTWARSSARSSPCCSRACTTR